MIKNLLSAIVLLCILIIGGDCMAGGLLSSKEKNIAKIASLSARGDLENLQKALNQALDKGLTINEIKEVLIQSYAYCGFPRSLNALMTLKNVVELRSNDKVGKEPKELPKDTDKFAYGDEVQVELTKNHVKGGIFDFAPAIDKYLKEHLFADIFSRGVLTYKEREIATIAMLSSIKGVESQLNSHIQMGKNTGLTDSEVKEIVKIAGETSKGGDFGLGSENKAYQKYFVGKSYLNPLTTGEVNSSNVTFEPGCRNNWHIHNKTGQILIVTEGRGYYQEWGKPAQELKRGDVVNIAPGIKHWHGAASDSWFSHIAISTPKEGATTDWLEEFDEKEYSKLK